MGFKKIVGQESKRDRRSWHGAAFSLEALLLLLFLVISATILIQIFSTSYLKGQQASALTPAIMLASNEAESFSANPTGVSTGTEFFDEQNNSIVPVEEGSNHLYAVTRTVTSAKEKNGTLYQADIEVTYKGSVIYDLTTARYISIEGVSGNDN